MTVSKPLRSIRLPFVITAAVAFFAGIPLHAQFFERYVRLHLRDKGTPRRYLDRSDPQYAAASSHLTQRALTRRAKVLPPDRLVSTDDLPIHPPYLAAISGAGARIVQQSRWLNTVMVIADSVTIERLRGLPFLDSVDVVRARKRVGIDPVGKWMAIDRLDGVRTSPERAQGISCLADHYGLADFQNRFMGFDEAHRMGFAGEGVLIGVLDAGFDWRNHEALRTMNVLDEFDFIYGNGNTADEPEDSAAGGSQEEHGTMVMSLIGARLGENDEARVVGGAPNASFMLAKTEDLRHERHVEEDTFVAGLEWLEAQGVDITNTSLGYTTFKEPERPHTYEELDGHTAHASRAINHAVGLGVVCIVAAGNEGRPGAFTYVSVPGEADSAIAAAAVDSSGRVAGFSSRGFPGRIPRKPDVAAFGVGNWAAHPSRSDNYISSQGTSFAAPMTTAVAAILLSAAPDLRPWEVRDLLRRGGSNAGAHDTAIGYGVVNAARVLRELARDRVVVGTIVTGLHHNCINVAAYVVGRDSTFGRLVDSLLVARVSLAGSVIELDDPQPLNGIARWNVPLGWEDQSFASTDSVDIEILDRRTGVRLRSERLSVLPSQPNGLATTPCALANLMVTDGGHWDPEESDDAGEVEAYPNPFRALTRLSFDLHDDATVTLSIHNSIGEEVARLFDGETLARGCHMPMFDAHGLPNGSYYVRLRVGGEIRTGEMIYIP
jgi:serine protease AprX